jgi:hypothetical protein
MKRKYRYIDPDGIIGVVVALVVLAVGVFAFFTVIDSISTETSKVNNSDIAKSLTNTTDTFGQVFNILGIVLIIGAIMSIVGLVYSYVGRGISRSSSSSFPSSLQVDEEEIKEKVESYKPPKANPFKNTPPIELGDYKLSGMESVDDALQKSKQYRETGFWTKIVNYENNKKISINADRPCGVYVSKWSKNESETYGKPKWSKNSI